MGGGSVFCMDIFVPFIGVYALIFTSFFILKNTQSLTYCMISLTLAWVIMLRVLGLTHSRNKPGTMDHFLTSYGLGTRLHFYYIITTMKDLNELQGQEMACPKFPLAKWWGVDLN